MDYELKVIINGVEVSEYHDNQGEIPSITNVKLKMATSLKGIGIGDTASDALYFTMLNPYAAAFDGAKVQFFISPRTDDSAKNYAVVEDLLGDELFDNFSDSNDVDALDDDVEDPEDEDFDELELAETERDEKVEAVARYTLMEGEDDELDTDETDEASEPKWLEMGVYYVYQTQTINEGLAFTCMDGMCLLTEKFTPNKKKAKTQEIYDDLRAQASANYGIVVDPFEFDDVYNVDLDWNYDYSFRQSLGFLAGIVGGYAAFDADGSVGITFYTVSDIGLIKENLITFQPTSEEMEVGGLICNVSTDIDPEEIESGTDSYIGFYNPFVTQAMLDDMVDTYDGIRYSGARFGLLWDYALQAGEFVRVMTGAEYSTLAGLKKTLEESTDLTEDEEADLIMEINDIGDVVMLTNMTIDFTGDAVASVDSVCDSETMRGANYRGQTMESLYVKMLKADFIDAEEIVVKALKADNAQIKNALVQNLEVKSINGNVIKDSTVLAKALSHEAVVTRSGIKVYYCTEDLMRNYYDIKLVTKSADDPDTTKPATYYEDCEGHVMVDGDTWYKTVVPAESQENSTDNRMFEYAKIMSTWKNGQWVVTPLDAELFRAGTITAREISSDYVYAGTLDSTQIIVSDDTLDTVLGEIAKKADDASEDAGEAYGLANTLITRVKITSQGVDLYNASGEIMASYGRQAQIGKLSESHIMLKSSGIDLITYNDDGDEIKCSFDADDGWPQIHGTEIGLVGQNQASVENSNGDGLMVDYTGNVYLDSSKNLYLNAASHVRSDTIYNDSTTYNANMYINSDGWIRRTNNSSSKRYKHDIEPLAYDARKLYDVEVIQFKYNSLSDDDERHEVAIPGVIAEDLDEILPIIVDHNDKGQPESWNRELTIPLMLKLIQEQHAEIEELKAALEVLKHD